MPESTSPPSEQASPGLNINAAHVVGCLLLAVLFLVLNFQPLYYSDLWGHVGYGLWILHNGQIPAEDPFAPLVAGEKIIDSAWLAQVLLGAVMEFGGAEWLSHLYAATMTVAMVLLGYALAIRSKNTPLVIVGTTLVVVFGWFRIAVIRPEMFGMLCFALLLLLAAILERAAAAGRSIRACWWLFAVIAITFVIWANCHGSFVVGIVLLGTLLVARAGEVLWQQRSGKALVADASLRCWLAATLLAGGASLVNPYGIGLFVNSLTFGRNPNLQDMTEWSAMQWGQLQTYYMLFCTVTFLAVAIVNRQRLRVTDVLLMVVFSIFLLRYVRMGFWYESVFAYVVTPLVAGMFARESDSAHPPNAVTMERRQKMSQVMGLVCILVVAAAFALSPLGRSILGRPPRPPQQLVASGTPLLATEFLLDHPPEGQVYNPQWWGDWLALAGPRGLKVFLTTNTVHVAPSELWKDYIAVAQLAPGWQQTLEKYDVTTIISDKQRMSGLSAELRKLPGYQIVYEDNVAIIATKEELIPPPEDQNADSGDSSAS